MKIRSSFSNSTNELNHKCGIAGISYFNKKTREAQIQLYKMLVQLQHRGQLSAGITVYKPDSDFLLQTHKDLGLVNNVFRAEHKGKFNSLMQKYSSTMGIGHTRYATCGADDLEYAQPFEHFHGKKNRWFSIAFNGNIANFETLQKNLEKQNYHFVRKTDTEAILLLLAKSLKDDKNLVSAFSKLATYLDGAYNIAFIDAEGNMVAARDSLGVRPLSYAVDKERIAFASESVALQSCGFKEIKDILPGQMLIVKSDGTWELKEFAKSEKKAHCFFEWVYFAHAASRLDTKLVYSVRRELGRELGKIEKQKIDENSVVVAVPDSSTPAGQGFSETVHASLYEGLIRNRYVGRTFIESKDRGERVRSKFDLVKEVFKGKKVFLIEDSIVRGTTLKNLVTFIRENGDPKEIHVRVSCPPIMWPCFYGIDMSTRKELIASKSTIDEIRKELGADSLVYQTEEGLVRALGLEKKDLCLACLNGIYPTIAGEKNSKNDKSRPLSC